MFVQLLALRPLNRFKHDMGALKAETLKGASTPLFGRLVTWSAYGFPLPDCGIYTPPVTPTYDFIVFHYMFRNMIDL